MHNFTMNKETLLNLLKEENYPAHMIENTIAKLEKLQPSVDAMFSTWVNTGKIPTVSIEGYTYSTLVRDYGMKPVGAFLTLDWLVREPERASASLKRGIR